MSQRFHENLARGDDVKVSSERSFGLVFAVVFTLVGAWPLMDGEAPRYWALAVALAFVLAAFLAPAWLGPLNRLWFRFGMLLHKVVNPIVLGLIFLVAIMPVALIMRLCGKDPMERRLDPKAESYWITREPAGPAPETMKDPF